MDDDFDLYYRHLKRDREMKRHWEVKSSLLDESTHSEPFTWQFPLAQRSESLSAIQVDHPPLDSDETAVRPFQILSRTLRPSSLAFMYAFADGNATLTFPAEGGSLGSISGIELCVIEASCELLATAFEMTRSGPRLYLETLSPSTAAPFLRYLYTGSYAEREFYEDVPTSLLLHCQLYYLGDVYEIKDLRAQACVNVIRQCEFGCSSPDPPVDLCLAIRFAYERLGTQDRLIDAILNYCVARFLDHRLGNNKEFTELAYELWPFHQALVRACRDREYEDESAGAIIQMPYKPHASDDYLPSEDPATAYLRWDVVYHLHTPEDIEISPKQRRRISTENLMCKFEDTPGMLKLPLRPAASTAPTKGLLTVALREHRAVSEAVGGDSASNSEDLRMVEKKRVSMAEKPALPASATDSDSEFEMVERPPDSEIISSDPDTDTDASVVLELKPSRRLAAAELLHLETAVSLAAAEAGYKASNWEDEWEYVG